MILYKEEITGERLKCRLLRVKRPFLGCKRERWASGRGSDNPARARQRPQSGQPPRTSIHDLHMDKNTDAQALFAHKVNHALGFTHIDADAHLGDYSRPPGASLKLFSRDLAERERGSAMSIRGSENESRRESLNFNRMLPGENSHHLCVSSVPESHSFL